MRKKRKIKSLLSDEEYNELMEARKKLIEIKKELEEAKKKYDELKKAEARVEDDKPIIFK